MKRSSIKDKILKCLIDKTCKSTDFEIGKHLNVAPTTIYTLMKEMEKQGHIETIQITSVNSKTRECSCRFVLPEAYEFRERTSYRWESIKQWWREAPKNYWALGTMFALLTSNAALVIKLFSKSQATNQSIKSVQDSIPQAQIIRPDSVMYKK